VVVTQTQAFPDVATADKLVRHVREIDAKLVVDLCAPVPDDQMTIAEVLLRSADAVWASSAQIAEGYQGAIELETRLDERLWQAPDTVARPWADPVRILCIIDSGHDDDFALIESVLERLQSEYSNRVAIDIVGRFVRDSQSTPLRHIRAPALALRSYPAFVHWLRSTSTPWHIGLAPSVGGGSATRLLEYAALGMATIASDVPAHRKVSAGFLGADLVRNTAEAWHEAVGWMIRDQDSRTASMAKARDAFLARGSLSSAAAQWRSAWSSITCKKAEAAVVLRQPTGILHKVHEQSRRTAGTRRPRH
jgi:hypothetical protein